MHLDANTEFLSNITHQAAFQKILYTYEDFCIYNFHITKTIYWQVNWHFCQNKAKNWTWRQLTSSDYSVYSLMHSTHFFETTHGQEGFFFTYVSMNKRWVNISHVGNIGVTWMYLFPAEQIMSISIRNNMIRA